MLKRLVFTLLIATTTSAVAQLTPPVIEVGAGLALRHTEGFYIPRFSVAGHKIYKGLGLYATYEQRNNAPFADDFNGDGNYQRYLVGPTLYINPNIYAYGGISPFGPYGLGGEGGFGKVRKEIGLAYVFAPFTLHAGYSNWVGFTTGVGYQFGGGSGDAVSFQSKGRPRRSRGAELAKNSAPARIDTVVVTKEVIKEVIKEVKTEVVREVVKEQNIELATTLYFNLNSTAYTSATSTKIASEIAALRAKYPNAELLVVGNTDESGSSTYNYNLGLARAQKVANYLMAKTGLDETKIVVRSDGKVRPQSDKKEDNRRVDIYVILDK
jgi:outer membrane protein OmpA-like peptidoglycan-associated protein